ncbi:MAG: hypothetical protein ACP5GD_03920 [Candidatus Micrarchaeia archaeon]|jgi:hypothetical protein
MASTPVKITFAPAKELVVHEVIEMSKEDLIRERITPAGNMPLYWCDGILFSFSSMPLTDAIVEDYLNGKLHWVEVHFARMPKYEEVLSLEAEEYKATMNVRVIDTSTSLLHKAFVAWLKSNIGEKNR